ncbi:hypothetical protein ACFORH_11040 [Amycolatopsis roodepoortensis]|uniref:SPOR domain-containing protein n=1 Tax=Amycolatopsis roodepoortensis TaxID=700274 RepID=A0ABR9LAL4_9PSEU|nr:hypothetical protein [Amycolatopsis roodepoortensis]MBE1577718.1 hypothetical protein [Amycolatopsis roodepoortensis]
MNWIQETGTGPEQDWYFNTRTGEVERGRRSRGVDLLGPYPDEETARRALEIARERTAAADRADTEWNDPE